MTLSMTEADIAAGVMVAQDMLYVHHLMESLELKVELPIVLGMDNLGAVDIANSGVWAAECIMLMYAIIFCVNSKTKSC